MINSFQGDYRWLSNFSPCAVEYLGEEYPSVENAYQAAKCKFDSDRAIFREVRAGEAKRLGRTFSIREDWINVRVSIMKDLLTQKFNQEVYKSKLKDTYPKTIVEGNTWGDEFWGVCEGFGENTLGLLIMGIREELIQEDKCN